MKCLRRRCGKLHHHLLLLDYEVSLLMSTTVVTSVAVHSHLELFQFDRVFLYPTFVVRGHTSYTFDDVISKRSHVVDELELLKDPVDGAVRLQAATSPHASHLQQLLLLWELAAATAAS